MTSNYADLAEAYAAVRDWFPQAAWEAMFTPEMLAVFTPKRGAHGMPPTLEVLVRQSDASRQRSLLVIDDAGWNDWETRTAMLTQFGAAFGAQPGTVMAIRLASEAWMRTLNATAGAAHLRANRPVADYPDRKEIMLCCGSTIDGRMASCLAQIHRDPAERIQTVDPWTVTFAEVGEALAPQHILLQNFWRAYHEAFLAKAFLDRHRPTED
jgi:hypothetical protein